MSPKHVLPTCCMIILTNVIARHLFCVFTNLIIFLSVFKNIILITGELYTRISTLVFLK